MNADEHRLSYAAPISAFIGVHRRSQHTSFWDRYMRSYDYLNKVDCYRQSLNSIVEKADPRPGQKIFEAGSGTGNLFELLAARGAEVSGCDISESAIAIHRKKNPYANVLQR